MLPPGHTWILQSFLPPYSFLLIASWSVPLNGMTCARSSAFLDFFPHLGVFSHLFKVSVPFIFCSEISLICTWVHLGSPVLRGPEGWKYFFRFLFCDSNGVNLRAHWMFLFLFLSFLFLKFPILIIMWFHLGVFLVLSVLSVAGRV